MIYLDHNATSFLRPAVLAAMREVEALALNPSSVHGAGRRARQLLEEARREVAQAISVFPSELTFTGSATEANNAVLRGFLGPRFVAATEHASIAKTGALLGADILPVDTNGLVDLAILDAKLAALSGTRALVSIMLANNETGVIQPIAEIANIVHRHGGLLHTDAVQAVGKIPLDCGLLGADMVTLGAHKIGGPVGIAALVIRQKQALTPLLTGGGQEFGHRAGTEDVTKAVGFAALMREVVACPGMVELQRLRDGMEAALVAAGGVVMGASIPPLTSPPLAGGINKEAQAEGIRGEAQAEGIREDAQAGGINKEAQAGGIREEAQACSVHSPRLRGEQEGGSMIPRLHSAVNNVPRLPNTSMIAMPGVAAETQIMHFDLAGFAVSAGSACSSGRISPSHVLRAMGVEEALLSSAIRISLGWNTTEAEIHSFISAWCAARNRLGRKADHPLPAAYTHVSNVLHT
jgi:cysteine desulfurase